MLITYDQTISITTPRDISKILQAWLKTLDKVEREKEHFFVVSLNVRSKIKNIDIVSIGMVDSVLVHPREVFRRAIIEASAQVLVAHNHPSGICEPSDEDIQVTNRLKNTGEVVGIHLIDHIVFSDTDHYSFVENGLL
jgi:DNA repair protein RadC